MLAVNHYDEFLKIVEIIAESYLADHSDSDPAESDIVVLVGPSSTGKSKLAARLLAENDSFEKLPSYTTKDPTAIEENTWYNYVSLENFRDLHTLWIEASHRCHTSHGSSQAIRSCTTCSPQSQSDPWWCSSGAFQICRSLRASARQA